MLIGQLDVGLCEGRQTGDEEAYGVRGRRHRLEQSKADRRVAQNGRYGFSRESKPAGGHGDPGQPQYSPRAGQIAVFYEAMKRNIVRWVVAVPLLLLCRWPDRPRDRNGILAECGV